jgi:hypothetical protein
MRKCFLHVGTHKTATTSIQHFLDSHPQELARSGYLYPRVGRPEEARAGHHNIAWEISGDRRFRADYGDGEALIREIADTDHNIIVSSEDFECSAHHAEKFGKFIVAIQKLGIRMSVIVYLRNQIDYAESLYCTLLQFGFDQPFSLFCDRILEAGAIQWREWIFPFRYDDFVAILARLGGVEIVARSYDRPTVGSPVLDFISTIGIGDSWVSSKELPHETQRLHLSEIVRRYWTNQTRQQLNACDLEAIAVFFDRYKGARPAMSLVRQTRFAEAFNKSNLRLCENYRLPTIQLMRQDRVPAAAGFSMDDIFGLDIRAVLPSLTPR